MNCSTVKQPKETHRRSLLELEGLGAELWTGVDAQEFVNELRDEWSTGRDDAKKNESTRPMSSQHEARQ